MVARMQVLVPELSAEVPRDGFPIVVAVGVQTGSAVGRRGTWWAMIQRAEALTLSLRADLRA